MSLVKDSTIDGSRLLARHPLQLADGNW